MNNLSNKYIRLQTYEQLGFTKEAFSDEYCLIRYYAYIQLGYTEKALTDKDWSIRLNGYKALRVRYKERLLCERNKPKVIKKVLKCWKRK